MLKDINDQQRAKTSTMDTSDNFTTDTAYIHEMEGFKLK